MYCKMAQDGCPSSQLIEDDILPHPRDSEPYLALLDIPFFFVVFFKLTNYQLHETRRAQSCVKPSRTGCLRAEKICPLSLKTQCRVENVESGEK